MAEQPNKDKQKRRRRVVQTKIDSRDRLELVLADWRTGDFTQTALSDKYGVDPSHINRMVKGVDKDTAPLINKIIEAKQELVNLDVVSRNAVTKVVDEKIEALAFFNKAQNRLATIAMESIEARLQQNGAVELSMNDLSGASKVIKDSREGILPKADASMNVQINTGAETPASINFIGMS